MNRKPAIPEDTRKSQAIAADPANSAWVSANAGSGKTHVLAQRVIRLLLQGADPSKILCLTYTRAAAANMANRVFLQLAGWSLLSDEELSMEIATIEGSAPDGDKLACARRLFARALETPGGLKIQTIHAFCEAILHQFPLEANIAGHFELLDTQMEQALLAEARRDLLTSATAGEGSALAEAFAQVLGRGGESGLSDLLSEIVARRAGLRDLIDQIGNDETPYRALFEEFGFSDSDSAEGIAASIWPLPGFDEAAFTVFVAEAEACDAKTVLKSIIPDTARGFVETDPLKRLALLQKGLLKTDGEPYGESTFKKALRAAIPDIMERYHFAACMIRKTADRMALYRMLETTRAALIIADGMIARYERLKRARGFLDFNDLIMRTIRLLARADAGPWVQYKLDKGIDHVLIDEAQDTSPEQWQIVRLLTEEFFTGDGARSERRTVFAVGDEKQSIYSFQGAEPAAFDESGREFEKKVRAAARNFERVRLLRSFRSTDDVLSATDLAFSRNETRKGLTRDDEPVDHRAIRAGQPGYVEVWSPIAPRVVEEPDDWTEAIDHASAPAVLLAETIAETVEDWIRNGEVIEGTGKRLTAGDVLVLVRKRDRFVHALSRSLKNRDIDVAGADRLRLTAHIAVQDLIALGRFLLQPHDDLSLAAVLRSPLFALEEERLFQLAWNRGRKTSLFDAMRSQALADPALAAIIETLQEWQTDAAFKPAFEFYAGLLAGTREREGARCLFVARLGHEANDILDEFLSFALAGERAGLNGLEVLLSALEGQAPEIKREMDQTRDELRIMTVHAAKGLEAPVVFLVDPGSAPFSAQHLPKLMSFSSSGKFWHGKGFLWRSGKDVANSVAAGFEAEAREKAEEEYRRLLYVGMTRAEDRLIVCGYHGLRKPHGLTWHNIAEAALAGAERTVERDTPAICAPVYRYRSSDAPPQEEQKGVDEASSTTPDLPSALLEPPPPQIDLPRPLSPSRAGALIETDHESVVSPRSPVLDGPAAPGFAVQRGLAIHRLLQMLPNYPEAGREQAAMRYLSRAGHDWSGKAREEIWRSVAAVLDDARFAPLFSPDSKAEISVVGELVLDSQRRAISGKIDRLALTEEAALIVDYKTNRPPPETLEEVPFAYVAQLALYAELLKPLYPTRRVEAALLFTEAPCLLPIPEERLGEALAQLKRA